VDEGGDRGDLARGEVAEERVDQVDREDQGADEEDERRQPLQPNSAPPRTKAVAAPGAIAR
jgi:hypothetical protein